MTDGARSKPSSFRDYWSANVAQFDDHGPKGISHVRGSCEGTDVDALVFRDKAGKVRGILYYHADRVHEEAAGNVTVSVVERFRRKGIATTLLREAEQRWPVNFDAQDYLDDGRALVNSYLAQR